MDGIVFQEIKEVKFKRRLTAYEGTYDISQHFGKAKDRRVRVEIIDEMN
jgi:hypothetical protein